MFDMLRSILINAHDVHINMATCPTLRWFASLNLYGEVVHSTSYRLSRSRASYFVQLHDVGHEHYLHACDTSYTMRKDKFLFAIVHRFAMLVGPQAMTYGLNDSRYALVDVYVDISDAHDDTIGRHRVMKAPSSGSSMMFVPVDTIVAKCVFSPHEGVVGQYFVVPTWKKGETRI